MIPFLQCTLYWVLESVELPVVQRMEHSPSAHARCQPENKASTSACSALGYSIKLDEGGAVTSPLENCRSTYDSSIYESESGVCPADSRIEDGEITDRLIGTSPRVVLSIIGGLEKTIV